MRWGGAVVVASAALLGAGCGTPHSSAAAAGDAGDDGGATAPRRACLVADTGGLGDQSFNQTAYEGEREAQAQYGWVPYALEAHGSNDYGLYIDAFMSSERCDLIIAVGALLSQQTAFAADQALYAPVGPVPQRFVLLDAALEPPRANVWAQTYQMDQAAFLAGYVAAAASQQHKVATFGGQDIAPVTDYMDGFILGVQAYNGKQPPPAQNVDWVGWDPITRTGTFIGTFSDQEQGRLAAAAFIAQGADVIMPVAGGAGFGAGQALLAKGSGYLVGVDSDWTKSAPQYKDIVLTSVLKKLDLSVVAAVGAVVAGTFAGGTVNADLQSGEIGLAPFLPGVVSSQVQTDLATLQANVIAGKVPTKP
jgi:basic membrane protein A